MVTLITFAFYEKKGIVGVMGFEILGVSTVGIIGLDVASDNASEQMEILANGDR